MARILIDQFYHSPPDITIGPLVAGAFNFNTGRYAPSDFSHPNGLSHLAAALAADGHDLRPLAAPYTDATLADADIVLAANPDYPVYPSSSPHRWTPLAVDALERFVRRGGGLLLLVNSFLSRPDFWEENFDLERVSLLFDRLGVHWDSDYMSSADIIEPAQTPEGRTIGYGQGGRVRGSLPAGVEPLLTYNGMTYGFRASVGSGAIVVLGDAGLISNGLVCFPGFDNLAYLRDLVGDLVPAWEGGWRGEWTVTEAGSVSAGPTPELEGLFRSLRPVADWSATFHYRHLTWARRATISGPDAVARLPIAPTLRHAATWNVRLPMQRLDTDEAGPPIEITLTERATEGPDGVVDAVASGRAVLEGLAWTDLCGLDGWTKRASQLEHVAVVFEQRSTLVRGELRAASWNQGQLVYARNTEAAHYGYEIVASSRHGAVAPGAALA
jgi:hypothetical protein